jgi:dolichyl-phosphate beta-glucosyltransferase
MDLSIVIPTLNEAHKIDKDVVETAKFLKEHDIDGEIIIVDDGSSDNTAEVSSRVKIPDGIERNVIRYVPNRGKGCAICTGIKESKGEFAMFADSGLCVPLNSILTGMDLIKCKACDIAHASRRLPESIIMRRTSLRRRLLSIAFRILIPKLMGIRTPLTDTQCGFKIYRGPVARELYGACRTEGFMFDIEIILRAEKLRYIIHEFPIEWTSDPDTRIHIGQTAERMFGELRAIKHFLSHEKT